MLGTQMKSVGEVMAIGRTFKQASAKGFAASRPASPSEADEFEERLIPATADHSESGPAQLYPLRVRTRTIPWRIQEMTAIDPWFLKQIGR